MFVRHRMTSPAITITPDTPVMDALQKMKDLNVHRFPVVDESGKLVGIVAEDDLLQAAPSTATTLSIFEMSYLLNRLTVSKIMAKNVVTVTEDTPLERAARIMAEKHFGGLPVLRAGKVIGMITETDIMLGFCESLGAYETGVRIMLEAPNEPGILANISGKIVGLGGNIASLAVFRSRNPENRLIVAKIQNVHMGELADILNDGKVQVLDSRDMGEEDLA